MGATQPTVDSSITPTTSKQPSAHKACHKVCLILPGDDTCDSGVSKPGSDRAPLGTRGVSDGPAHIAMIVAMSVVASVPFLSATLR